MYSGTGVPDCFPDNLIELRRRRSIGIAESEVKDVSGAMSRLHPGTFLEHFSYPGRLFGEKSHFV
jgi:hypothetical protein